MKYRNLVTLLCIIVAVLGVMAIRKRTRRNRNRKTRKGGSREKFEIQHKNILGTSLAPCSTPPGKTTGYYRDGYCSTGPTDTGTHVVCAKMDNNFLAFTKSKGNDLITPQNSFPGLVAGDKWCVCALRWKEAHDAGKAPKLFPAATSDVAAQYVEKNVLMNYALP
jgi:uncharacterized protein (DUF2237 family)